MDTGYFVFRDTVRVLTRRPVRPFSAMVLGLMALMALVTNPGFLQALALFLLFLAIIGMICLFEADRGNTAASRGGRATSGPAERPRGTNTRT